MWPHSECVTLTKHTGMKRGQLHNQNLTELKSTMQIFMPTIIETVG